MYLAEIHGKLSSENENREDILTSNVFSFFKYGNREIFLLRLFQLLGLEVTTNEAHQAEFFFWPCYIDGTEPDLVIQVGRYYLLFEAKLKSSFSPETAFRKHQLVREIEGGAMEAKSLDKEFRIITVTADYSRPNSLNAIPEYYWDQLIWINWQRIALLLFSALESNPKLSGETRLFANDLYKLLIRKKLRNFEGINVLGQTRKLKNNSEMVFFEAKTATYRGDFIGFLEAFEGTAILNYEPERLFYSRNLTHIFWSRMSANLPKTRNINIFFKEQGTWKKMS